MDYAITLQGRTVTPNGTTVDPSDVDARNAAMEAAELARWAEGPDVFTVYYRFPDEPSGGPYRQRFSPRRTAATVSTWMGTELGLITDATVYPHNFGGRFVAVSVYGNNGYRYHGRASWDGSVITLRRVR